MTDNVQSRALTFLYDAFISYRHVERDRKWAEWLIQALEDYRVPRTLQEKGLPSKLKIFRDEDEMPASSDLSDQIKSALKASRFLIVVCSPYTPRSRWVEREIEIFHELGRDDHVLALLTEGEPRDSFPSAILERHLRVVDAEGREQTIKEGKQPLAADVRPRKGVSNAVLKRIALLRLAACILGVRFDDLRQRERERQRRKQLAWGSLAATLTMLVGAGGLGYWQVTRPKAAFYRHVVWRWGLPEGLGRIDEETRSQLQTSYRVVTQRERVTDVTHQNSVGSLRSVDDDEGQEDARWLVDYRENGPAEKIDIFDRSGKLIREDVLKRDPRGDRMFVTFERDNTPFTQSATQRLMIDPLQSGSEGFPNRSEITRHEVIFDKSGCTIERRFQDYWGQPRRDAQDSFGERFDCSAEGLPTRRSEIGADGSEIVLKNGTRAVTFTYDQVYNRVRKTSLGADERPIIGHDGYASYENEFDRWGNRIAMAYFDDVGKPTPTTSGYAKATFAYDERGNQVETAFLGVDGKPTLDKHGYNKSMSTFDARGNEIERAYFGIDGTPALHKEGYAKWTAVYDDRGRQIEKSVFGVDGKPVFDTRGFHKRMSTFDANGNEIDRADFGVDGKPTLNKFGFWKWVDAYDARGNPIEWSYFGIDGKPVLANGGVAKVAYSYDARGNLIAMSCFGVDGQPVLYRDGFAKLTRSYDVQGNLIEVAYFGVNGEPVLNKFDVARVSMAYDERGNRIEVSLFGVDGQPVLHREGYAKMTAVYDARGNQTETAFFGVDGRPALFRYGYARSIAVHDARGDVIEQAYFGLGGEPVLSRFGYARRTNAFDAHGKVIAEAFFGADGKPILSREGYASSEHVFDARGNMISETLYGVDGMPRVNAYARRLIAYDGRDNKIEATYFSADGEPVLRSDGGFHKVTYSYDARGRQIGARFVDVQGRNVAVDVIVRSVLHTSIAADVGVAPGDRLVSYNGEKIISIDQFDSLIAAGGTTNELVVHRGADTHAFPVAGGPFGLEVRFDAVGAGTGVGSASPVRPSPDATGEEVSAPEP
jgi:hypothetical protein